MKSHRTWTRTLAVALATALMACGSEDGQTQASDTSPQDTGAQDIGTGEVAEGDASDVAVSPDTVVDVVEDTGPPEPVCPPITGERPSRRSEHGGIYDPVGDRVLFYGGSFAIPENCSFAVAHTFETELWSYNIPCDSWSQITDAGLGPAGRNRAMFAYDSTRHRMLLFGGRYRAGTSGTYTHYNDVWALDLQSDIWSPVSTTGVPPSARVNGSMVYDPTGDRLLLFGGNEDPSGMSYAALNDLWELDLTSGAWTVLQAAGPKPTARLFAAALWDESRQWFVIFGGADNGAFFNTAAYFNDLYALDFSANVPTWQLLSAPGATAPDGRFWAGMVQDAARDRYLVFGGHDDKDLGNRNDLWAYHPASWAWEELDEADTWNKPANDVCDFPPDFTNVDYDAPERRNAAVFVVGQDAAWLTGGKTDCGAVDDMVRLDLETATWEDMTTATVGVTCLRKGGLNCNDLCF